MGAHCIIFCFFFGVASLVKRNERGLFHTHNEGKERQRTYGFFIMKNSC